MKKKILQICNFSSGISGVLTRALEDSREFINRGYEAYIFSSNEEEDGKITSLNKEIKEGIDITRFPVKRKKGYALWFDFKEEAIKLKPDIIICHGLRKPYLQPAIDISKQLGIKCFCITHAPFIDKDLRDKKLNFSIWLYDKFLGKRIMNSFDRIIAICKWEKEVLLELGCDEERIFYLPNSISDEFFTKEPVEEKKKILFLGRMHPIKEIEVLIEAFKTLSETDYELEIISSVDGEYFKNLQKLKNDKITFTAPIYDLNEKIKKIDEAEMFVLPSRKESLPFGVIEAMSRGKIVIVTKTKGGLELIEDSVNGFLFNIGDEIELGHILNKVIHLSSEKKEEMRRAAKDTANNFQASKNMERWEGLFK